VETVPPRGAWKQPRKQTATGTPRHPSPHDPQDRHNRTGGDTTPTGPAAGNAALASSLGLIWYFTLRHPLVARRRLDPEDVVQTACVFFLLRFEWYDGERLSAYCRLMVRDAVQQECRHLRLKVRRLGEDSEGAQFDPPAAPAGEPQVERDENIARVRQALRRLSPARRELLVRRFGLDGGEPATVKGLGEAAGVTNQRIDQRVQRALFYLGNLLGGVDRPGQPDQPVAVAVTVQPASPPTPAIPAIARRDCPSVSPSYTDEAALPPPPPPSPPRVTGFARKIARRVQAEGAVPVADLAGLAGTDVSTMVSWATEGVRCPVGRVWLCGFEREGVWYTSRQAVRRFLSVTPRGST
jgi:RNA polymerase sigma factor (sigma-70 family)